MLADDFRLNEFSPDVRVDTAKASLKEELLSEHAHAQNMYSVIQRHHGYKEKLGHAYGDRCAYCGVPIGCIGYQSFQIDYIVCKNGNADDRADVPTGIDSIENLAFACVNCNGKKHDFTLTELSLPLLSPDMDLGTTFVRNDDFSIEISHEYAGCKPVRAFYDRMHYGSELRRIDYLIASLFDLDQYVNSNDELGELASKISDLLRLALGSLIPRRNKSSIALIA
ncbi:MAG: HNH endonuclease [Eggerthellaceae bacterium]|nr:HNH endonuclease [Eggerthellaceae bacterium]